MCEWTRPAPRRAAPLPFHVSINLAINVPVVPRSQMRGKEDFLPPPFQHGWHFPNLLLIPRLARSGQVEDTTEPTNIRVSLVHLGHRPMAEDIQRKPSPGAPGTQTSALPWLKEPHADPQGPAMTWWVLTKSRGITEHGKPRLCPHPVLHHPHLGAQLASWGVSSSPG